MVALCSLKQQSNGLQHVLLTASAGSCAKRLPHAKAAAFRTATYESGRQQLVSREARTKSKQAKTVGALRNHLKHCVRERELARIARHSTRPVTSTLLEASIGDLVTAGILRRNCQSGSRRPGGNSVRPQNSLLAGYCERRKERNGSLCCMKEHPKAQQHEEPSPSLVARFFRLFSREQKAVPRPQENGSTTELREGPFEIQLQDVSRVYGKRTVVDGVNLSVKQGEVVGLLGPNGAGKSTTFNITVGRERPSQGCVLLNGRDITALPLAARARLGVGYLPQEPSVFRGLSVRDNLLLILQETGVPRAKQAGRIEKLLAEFRLTHVQHTKGGALSGGERRRTELARALASNCSGGPPRILLVDEPFAGVDPIGVAEIQALLRKLCDELHMGILITDHNVTETLKICDRAYMVFQGQVMAQGSPQELVQNPFVRQYYLGEGYRRPETSINGEESISSEERPTS